MSQPRPQTSRRHWSASALPIILSFRALLGGTAGQRLTRGTRRPLKVRSRFHIWRKGKSDTRFSAGFPEESDAALGWEQGDPIHRSRSSPCRRLRRASAASRPALGQPRRRVSFCRWQTAGGPRYARHRPRVSAQRGEGLEQQCRRRCLERPDAWVMRAADRPRACPARHGGMGCRSDRCSAGT